MVILEANGRDDWGRKKERCPWGPPGSDAEGRHLVDVLTMWKNMIEDGIWSVDEEGVEGTWRDISAVGSGPSDGERLSRNQ